MRKKILCCMSLALISGQVILAQALQDLDKSPTAPEINVSKEEQPSIHQDSENAQDTREQQEGKIRTILSAYPQPTKPFFELSDAEKEAYRHDRKRIRQELTLALTQEPRGKLGRIKSNYLEERNKRKRESTHTSQ